MRLGGSSSWRVEFGRDFEECDEFFFLAGGGDSEVRGLFWQIFRGTVIVDNNR